MIDYRDLLKVIYVLSHGKSTSAENYEICKPDSIAGGRYRVLEILLATYPPITYNIHVLRICAPGYNWRTFGLLKFCCAFKNLLAENKDGLVYIRLTIIYL